VQAPIIVTVEEPRDRRWSFPAFYEALRERGFSIYPGKVTVRPTFRVGCIGRVYPEDLARFVAAAGEALDGMGLVDR
jgi:2-aminoethylphosphonate-pyruvate transaminase